MKQIRKVLWNGFSLKNAGNKTQENVSKKNEWGLNWWMFTWLQKWVPIFLVPRSSSSPNKRLENSSPKLTLDAPKGNVSTWILCFRSFSLQSPQIPPIFAHVQLKDTNKCENIKGKSSFCFCTPKNTCHDRQSDPNCRKIFLFAFH